MALARGFEAASPTSAQHWPNVANSLLDILHGLSPNSRPMNSPKRAVFVNRAARKSIPLSAVVFALSVILVGCTKTPEAGLPVALNRASCDVEQDSGQKRDGATTFCIHEVVSMTPLKGSCDPSKVGYGVGDKLCLNCPDGRCPNQTEFATNDGFFLTACRVTTKKVEADCKDIFPRGTCVEYVTLSR